MKNHDLKELGEAILKDVHGDVTPNQIIRAVRKKHPGITKKELVRAAFYALIAHADSHPEEISTWNDFAIMHRTSEDEGK